MTNDSVEEVSVDSVILANLERVLAELEISNYTISSKAGSQKGDNYLGIIIRSQVNGTDKKGDKISKNFILKCAITTEGYRKSDVLEYGYEREIYVYTELHPFFESFQKERGITNPFNSYPKFYASSTERLHESLIFDDMAVKGYFMQDRLKPLNDKHCKMVVSELGKWHALAFALRDQEPETYQNWRKKNVGKFVDRGMVEDTLNDRIREVANTFDPIKQKRELEKFKEVTENLVDDMFDLLDADAANGYEVFLHGDCWINNMLFQYKDPKYRDSPSKICFLDWQLLRVGSPLIDIFYFIYASTDKQLRDHQFNDIMKEYYTSLGSYLKELGSEIKKLYPEKIFKDDMKKFSKWGLATAHLLVPIVVTVADELPNMIEETETGRNLQDIMKEIVTPEHALIRIRECFLHLYENNLL